VIWIGRPGLLIGRLLPGGRLRTLLYVPLWLLLRASYRMDRWVANEKGRIRWPPRSSHWPRWIRRTLLTLFTANLIDILVTDFAWIRLVAYLLFMWIMWSGHLKTERGMRLRTRLLFWRLHKRRWSGYKYEHGPTDRSS
jgi:hypothetical protein